MLLVQQSATHKVPTAKLAAAVGGALGVTIVLFAVMQQLITVKNVVRVSPLHTPVVTLFEPVKDSEPDVRKPIPPRPEVKPRDVPPSTIEPVDSVSIGGTEFTIAEPVLPKGTGQGTLKLADRSATPLVRIEPRYPVTAARDGISGWVRLGFSIDESGAVTDVVVLAAEPARTFDREAMAALKRWKYQPKVIDGKTIKQTDMQVQLDFSLNNS